MPVCHLPGPGRLGDNNPPQYLLDDTVLDLLRYQNIVTLLLAFIVLSRGY